MNGKGTGGGEGLSGGDGSYDDNFEAVNGLDDRNSKFRVGKNRLAQACSNKSFNFKE